MDFILQFAGGFAGGLNLADIGRVMVPSSLMGSVMRLNRIRQATQGHDDGVTDMKRATSGADSLPMTGQAASVAGGLGVDRKTWTRPRRATTG